jgi:hypothetical protein
MQDIAARAGLIAVVAAMVASVAFAGALLGRVAGANETSANTVDSAAVDELSIVAAVDVEPDGNVGAVAGDVSGVDRTGVGSYRVELARPLSDSRRTIVNVTAETNRSDSCTWNGETELSVLTVRCFDGQSAPVDVAFSLLVHRIDP